jgi:hypothetical protein
VLIRDLSLTYDNQKFLEINQRMIYCSGNHTQICVLAKLLRSYFEGESEIDLWSPDQHKRYRTDLGSGVSSRKFASWLSIINVNLIGQTGSRGYRRR